MTFPRRIATLVAASALGLAGAIALPSAALAADVFVTTAADNGPGSLRAALANSLAGDTIRFDSSFDSAQTIELESQLIIDHTITIIGPGSDLLSLVRDDASAFNQFEVQAEGGVTDLDVTVSGMTIDGSVDGTPHAGQGSGFQSLDATVNNLLFQDVVIRNQIATHGAAINVENAEESIFFANCHLFNNIADSSGGAARFTSLDADVSFNGGSISSNQARAGNGGGLEFVGPGALTMYGTAVTSNTAVDLGGGLYLQGPTDITLENTFFQDNGAWSGGGVYVNIYNGDFDITTSTFDDNFASGSDGGALNVQTLDPAQTLTVTSSLFSDNRAASDGVEAGAAIATGSIDGEVTIDSSTFSQNNFAEPGRGLSLAVMGAVNGELSIVNSTIDEFLAADDFALYIGGVSGVGVVSIANSTITGPGALRASENDEDAAISVSNSIVDGEVDVTATTVATSYNLFSEPFGATFVDDGTSRFGITNFGLLTLANNGGPTPTRLLAASSPALNNGDPAFGAALSFDQRGDGYPRVIGRLDIGAIEMPAALAATGSTGLPIWVPIVGGIVLLAGIGFVVFSVVNRRKSAGAVDAGATSAGEPGPGTGGDSVFPEASSTPPTAEPPAENDPR